MKTDKLYSPTREDIPKAVKLLTDCFEEDPLYQKLIPVEEIRKRAMPEIMSCDAEEMFSLCNVYADSPELNGLLITDDETEPYNHLRFFSAEAFYALKTDAYLIKEDWSMKTLWNFFLGRSYLNSQWLEELDSDRRIHIIYLAVSPQKQGEGIAGRLIKTVIDYADHNGLMITLETHNPQNISFYKHYGFEVFKTQQSHFDLNQYCIIRKPKVSTGINIPPATSLPQYQIG